MEEYFMAADLPTRAGSQVGMPGLHVLAYLRPLSTPPLLPPNWSQNSALNVLVWDIGMHAQAARRPAESWDCRPHSSST